MSEPIAGNPMADEMIVRVARAIEPETFKLPLINLNKAAFDRAYARAAAAIAVISRPSITADAVAWQRRYKGGEGWELISKTFAEKLASDADSEFEVRALFTHPAPEGAGDTEPHAWAQWARVTYKSGALRRQELLTAKLPFVIDEENDQIKIELLGEPQALYTHPLEGAGDTEPGDLVERLKWLCDPSAETMPERERLTAFVHAGIDTLSVLVSLRAERDAWAKNALDNDDCRIMWQVRAEAAESSLAAEKRHAATNWQHFADERIALSKWKARAEVAEVSLAAEKQRVVDLEKYAREATKAITSLTVGGSEYFGRKIGEMYTADLALCVQHVRERDTRTHDWMTKAVSERKAAKQRVAALEGALAECAAGWSSPPTTIGGAFPYLSVEFQRRMHLAADALAHP